MNVQRKGMGILLMAGLVAGCGGDSSDDPLIVAPPAAQVRVLHASPDAPNVDVRVDGTVVLEDVAFQQASANLSLSPGERQVEVLVAGTDSVVLDQTFPLEDGDRFSVLAANNLASLEYLVVEENSSAVSAGNARVNVVHGSPAAGTVDIYVTGYGADLPASPTLDDVPFKASQELTEVPAGEYQVRITGSADTDVVYDSGPLQLDSGANLTVVAVDSKTSLAPVDLVVLTGTTTNPVIVDDTAFVRVVHGVPGALVDVYVNEGASPALEDFAFGETSGGYVEVNSSPKLDVTLADGNIADAVISQTATLDRGSYYTVIANGTVSDADTLPLGLYLLEDDLTAAGAGEARLRVIHAAPFAEGTAADVDVYAAEAGNGSATTINGLTVSSLASDLGYQDDSGYLVVPADTYTALVTPAGSTDVAIAAEATLAATEVYSVIALGDGNAEALTLLPLQDQP